MKHYKLLIIICLIAAVLFSIFYQDRFIGLHQLQLMLKDHGFRLTFIELIIPTIITTFICGYLLGNIGLIMQNTFNNGLVGPELLGISALISCVSVIDLTLQLHLSLFTKFLINTVIACSMGVLLISAIKYMRNMIEVILMGTIIGMLINGVIIWLMSAGGVNNATIILNYLLGTVNNRRTIHMWIAIGLFIIFLAIYPIIIKQLKLSLISDELSLGIGANVMLSKIILLIISLIFTAGVVTLIGPISFVAVLTPHIARFLTNHIGWQCFYAGCTGSLILLASLNFSNIASVLALPTGILTSIIGIPLFLIILIKKHRSISL